MKTRLQLAIEKRARRRRRNLGLPWCPAGPVRIEADASTGWLYVLASCGRCGCRFTSGAIGWPSYLPNTTLAQGEADLRRIWGRSWARHNP